MKNRGISSLRRQLYRGIFGISLCAASLQAQQEDNPEQELKYYRDSGIQPIENAEQGGDIGPGTFIITHDIIIAKGKLLRFHPGSRIFLTQNAMIVVNGTLICAGSDASPIEFRKLDNKNYFRPVDPRLETRWDGIYLPDSAILKMRSTVVSGSKYGIVVSGKNVSMIFERARFVNNKFQNVKIGERMMKITENSPVVFHYPEQEGIFVAPATVLNATETIQQKKGHARSTDYPGLRVAMGICAGAGLVCGGTGAYIYRKNNQLFSTTPEELETTREEYRSKAAAGSITGIAGALLFGIGVAGFTWTFFF